MKIHPHIHHLNLDCPKPSLYALTWPDFQDFFQTQLLETMAQNADKLNDLPAELTREISALKKISQQGLKNAYKSYFLNWQHGTVLSQKTKDEFPSIHKLLQKWIQATFESTSLSLIEVQKDPEDGTEKFIFDLYANFSADSKTRFEAVLIPHLKRFTLCVSSQVGCKLACQFCATGYMGFRQNLSAAAIVEQVRQVIAYKRQNTDAQFLIDNLVFMGMGEPLDNLANVEQSIAVLCEPLGFHWPARKISVSTSGILPAIKVLREKYPVRLLISLHALEEEVRSQLMPINRKYTVQAIRQFLLEFPFEKGEQITLSYLLMDQINDQKEHAEKLIAWCAGLPAKVNLLPYHKIPFAPEHLKPSPLERMQEFRQALYAAKIPNFFRHSKGEAIGAACGMLFQKSKN